MFCKHCGQKIKEGNKFCPNCGKTIDKAIGLIDGRQKKHNKTKLYTILSLAIPIGLFIATITLWGVINTFVNSKDSSNIVELVNLIVPLVVAIALLLMPVGVFFAIFFHLKNKG